MKEIILKRGITLNYVVRYENVNQFIITNSILIADIVAKELEKLLIDKETLYILHEAQTIHGLPIERAIIITKSEFPDSIIDKRDTELFFGEDD